MNSLIRRKRRITYHVSTTYHTGCITHISQHNTVHRVHTVNLKNFKTLSSLFPSPWRVTFCSRLPSSKFFQNKKVEVPNPSSNK